EGEGGHQGQGRGGRRPHREGVAGGHRHAPPRGQRLAHVRGPRPRRHQHPDDLHLRDQDLGGGRREVHGARRARAAQGLRARQGPRRGEDASMRLAIAAAIAMTATLTHAQTPAAPDDPYQWLEDVEGAKAMAWVKERNAVSQPQLEAKPGFKRIHERLLAIYNSKERIPGAQKRGKWLYNFWQDEHDPR